jgi:hypothetical protein
MAYKFQRGAFRASGSTVIEEGLTIDASGLTVTGSSNVQALTANSLNVDSVSLDANILSGLSQLTASAISASTAQFGSITVPTLSSTNLDLAGYLAVEGATRLSGTVALGDAVGDVITVNGQITGSLFAITGGTINNTAIGGTTQAAGQFTTLSASSNLQVGTSVTASTGVLVNAGGVIVTAGGLAVNAGNLAVSNGNISGSGLLQAGGQLTVAQLATLNGGLTITTGGATISGSTNTSGSIIIGGNGSLFALTADVSNLQVANIKAKDGTSAGSIANSTGVVTLASTVLTTTDINGGTIDGTTIGATAQSSVKATTLSASSNLQVGTSITASSGILVNAGGLTVSDGDSSLQKLTVNGDLIVLGTTFSASVGSLLIEDAAIVIGDGSTAFGTGYGINFGSGSNQWATLLTAQDNIDGIAGNENILSSSLAIKAPAFAGTFYGTMASTVTQVGDADATLVVGVNYGTTNLASVSKTWTLPASAGLTVGQSIRVKAPAGLTSTRTIIIAAAGSQTIDGETTIVLESDYAAVELVYVNTDTWRVF